MKQYKLTSYATGSTIAEGWFKSIFEAWTTLAKSSSDSVIAVLWIYDKEVPFLLNEEVIKAYNKKYGENPHGIAPIEYCTPFCIGLTGDDFTLKQITLEKDSGFVKVGNDPNKTLYIPKGAMKKHVEQDKSE